MYWVSSDIIACVNMYAFLLWNQVEHLQRVEFENWTVEYEPRPERKDC